MYLSIFVIMHVIELFDQIIYFYRHMSLSTRTGLNVNNKVITYNMLILSQISENQKERYIINYTFMTLAICYHPDNCRTRKCYYELFHPVSCRYFFEHGVMRDTVSNMVSCFLICFAYC